jgi:hypothetical protein
MRLGIRRGLKGFGKCTSSHQRPEAFEGLAALSDHLV